MKTIDKKTMSVVEMSTDGQAIELAEPTRKFRAWVKLIGKKNAITLTQGWVTVENQKRG